MFTQSDHNTCQVWSAIHHTWPFVVRSVDRRLKQDQNDPHNFQESMDKVFPGNIEKCVFMFLED